MVMQLVAVNELHRAEERYEVGKVRGEEEVTQRQLRAILNKLTPENFENLLEQVREVNIKDAASLGGFVSQIVAKALAEPLYCETYADLCNCLTYEMPDFSNDNERITFKRFLLNYCQEIFESKSRVIDEGKIRKSEKEKEDEIIKARVLWLGNMRLIGELFKKGILTVRIILHCISTLLNPANDEVDIEALCLLMKTAGEMLDHLAGKKCMDVFFDKLMKLSANSKLSLRIRFMLMDTIDLRKNKWQHKRSIEKPKKISEVQSDATQQWCGRDRRLVYRPVIHFSVGWEYVNKRNPSYTSDRLPDRQDDWLSLQNAVSTQRWVMPHQTPSQGMHKSERRYEVGKVFGREDAKQRKLRSILNKLVPQNMRKLLLLVKQVNINSIDTLAGFAEQLFQRALVETAYCELYVNFASYLDMELHSFLHENRFITFKKLLLDKCQVEFDRSFREEVHTNLVEEEGTGGDGNTSYIQGRQRKLGNLQFIGELCKVRLLHEKIVLHCIEKLLEHHNSNDVHIEGLCKLMSTVGEMIDHPRFRKSVDRYFDMMEKLSIDQKLTCRLRFMLMDVIDLKKNKWQDRRKIEKPKKTEEGHKDVSQECSFQCSRRSNQNATFEASTLSGASPQGRSVSVSSDFIRDGSSVIEISSSSDENDEVNDNHLRNLSHLDLKVEKKERVEEEEEDCYILEGDPSKSLTVYLSHKHSLSDHREEDICIVAEQGQVACRDYPHSRHLCAVYPFNTTAHENCCAQCYCYVCDAPAPCENWDGSPGHCHASDREKEWIDRRAARCLMGSKMLK